MASAWASASAAQTLQSSASSLTSLQPRASTSPVLEFVCLFTHDLRRKQKRWQDGRLKYHTFNKRVMVYDERGNFIGDTHWCEDYDFDEGEELQLERGSSLVQVAECVGSRDQDLSELVDKRAQEKAKRQSAALARRAPTAESTTPQAATPHFQLQQRPLQHVIGTPTGHHGRALIPTESPYEGRQRQIASPQDDNTRPAKRRKRDVSPPSKSGYAQSLFGAPLTLLGGSQSSAPVRRQLPKALYVREDNRAPISSDPSHQDSDPDHEPMTMHEAPLSTRQHRRNVISGGSLLRSKPPRPPKPPTQVITIDEPDLPPSPARRNVDINGEKSSTAAIAPISKPEATGTAATTLSRTQNPLRSTSVNRNLRDSQERNEALKTSAEGPILHTTAVVKNRLQARDDQLRMNTPKTIDRKRGSLNASKTRDTSKIVDLTADQELSPIEPPSIGERRTELRIKPRKKRGLLMMSEKGADNASLSISKKTKTQKGHDHPSKPFAAFIDDLDEMGSGKEVSPAIEGRKDGTRSNRDVARIIDDDPFDYPETEAIERQIPVEPKTSTRKGRRKKEGKTSPSDSGNEAVTRKQTKSLDIEIHSQKEISISSHLRRQRHSASPLGDDSSTEAKPRTRRHGRHEIRNEVAGQSPEHQDDVWTDEDSPPRKRRSLRKKKAPIEAVEDGHDEPEVAPPPRLAHLGRKNIRSREVIGFIFEEDEELVSRGSTMLNSRTGQESAVHSHSSRPTTEESPAALTTVAEDDAAVEEKQANDRETRDHKASSKPDLTTTGPTFEQRSDSPKTQDLSGQPTVAPLQRQDSTTSNTSTTGAGKNGLGSKLINPATRGRKAAKPSDAAGQMPMCPLPSEAGPVMHLPPEEPLNTKRPGLGSGKTTSGPMPGFARANGGPWSREAHDLFEFRRPA